MLKMIRIAPVLGRAALALRGNVLRRITTGSKTDAKLNNSVIMKYMKLPMPGDITLADYIWIDGSGTALRSRTRTLDFRPVCVEQLPQWSVDGSQTNQARSHCDDGSDIRLMPVAMYNDPMRGCGAKLVLCEAYSMDYKPLCKKCRTAACEAFNDTKRHKPLFGFCQQYMLVQADGTPMGWPGAGGELPTSNDYFCGVGSRSAIGREIVEAHARACLYAGVHFAGFHSDQLPSKWRFEIKPTAGIKAPDDIIVGRYLLSRIAAEFGLDASFHPKLLKQKEGSGLHVKFTTAFMSENNGFEQIVAAVMALAKTHKQHMKVYDTRKGKDNRKRLGKKGFKKFSIGTGRKRMSVRIPLDVQTAGCGYLEDLRPAANCNPYAVCNAMLRTICCQAENKNCKPNK